MNRPDKILISPSFMLAVPNKITSSFYEGLKAFILNVLKKYRMAGAQNTAGEDCATAIIP